MGVLDRLVLGDVQWGRLSPHIMDDERSRGSSGRNNRLFVEGVLWIVPTGAPWRDLPADLFPTATRSAIVVKSGNRRPEDADAAVQYRKAWYWLMDDDTNSKTAFIAVEILEAIAQSSSSSQAPLVTIPAN